jgi:hypothetical protein
MTVFPYLFYFSTVQAIMYAHSKKSGVGGLPCQNYYMIDKWSNFIFGTAHAVNEIILGTVIGFSVIL